jgi:hypothetical protein
MVGCAMACRVFVVFYSASGLGSGVCPLVGCSFVWCGGVGRWVLVCLAVCCVGGGARLLGLCLDQCPTPAHGHVR